MTSTCLLGLILFFELQQQSGKAEKRIGRETIAAAQMAYGIKYAEDLTVSVDQYGRRLLIHLVKISGFSDSFVHYAVVKFI